MTRRWTRAEIESLGKKSDPAVARELGLSIASVQKKRKSLGIPAFSVRIHWGQTDLSMLGRYPDKEISMVTGRKADEIQRKREELGLDEPA